MTKKSTVIFLKDTGHIIAAFDRRSGAALPNFSSFTEQFLRKDLRVRLLEPFGAFEVKSDGDVDENSTSMTVENAEAFFVVPSGQFKIGDAIGTITNVEVSPADKKKATIDFTWEKKPSTTISKGASVRLPLSPRSRMDLYYQLPPRLLSFAEVEFDGAPLLSRPTCFVFNDGKASEQAANNAPSGVLGINLQARNTRINLTLTLDKKNPIKKDVSLVCVMKTQQGENVISEAKIIAPQGVEPESASTEIQFGGIPGGKHNFLFMLKGFHPLWCDLSFGETVSWPTSM